MGTAVINYRLTSGKNKVKHPDHVEDAAKAFAWLHANGPKYGGRADRMFLAGHSAGGHLVALLATDEQYLKAEKLSLDAIRGVMPLSGVYQIVAGFPAFSLPFGDDKKSCEAASPLTHVKEKLPPFLIAYGDKDFPTLDKMAEDFGKKLKQSKCEAEVLKLEKRDHFTIIINLIASAADPLTAAMLKFIDKHTDAEKK